MGSTISPSPKDARATGDYEDLVDGCGSKRSRY
jgi:hypothetical protein